MQEELDEIFQKESENIIDVTNLEDVCQVILQQKAKQNRKGNATILAFITSYNRIYLHKSILSLVKDGFRVHYCDCDSIFFSGESGKQVQLPISHSFGDFKLEFKDKIESFRAFKRKTYFIATVSIEQSQTERKSNYKVCGLNLKPCEVRKTFDHVIKKGEGKIPQVRHIFNKEAGKKEEKLKYFSWNTETKCQRKVLHASKFLATVPWGYYQSNNK